MDSELILPQDPVEVAVIFAVMHLTNWTKEALKEWEMDGVFGRLYFFLPYLWAIPLCLVLHQSGCMATCALKWGMYATVGWQFYKKPVRGE